MCVGVVVVCAWEGGGARKAGGERERWVQGEAPESTARANLPPPLPTRTQPTQPPPTCCQLVPAAHEVHI